MFEHVGRSRFAEYFRGRLRRAASGRTLLNHSIADQSPGRRRRGPERGLLGHFVFPDGELVAVADSLRVAEQTGFEVRDVENLREHYTRTRTRLDSESRAQSSEAIAAAGEASYRMWRSTWPEARKASTSAGSASFSRCWHGRMNDGRVKVPPTRRDLYATLSDGASGRSSIG